MREVGIGRSGSWKNSVSSQGLGVFYVSEVFLPSFRVGEFGELEERL